MVDLSAFGGKALQSLRNNDFNPFAAIAEVIDNSLEANAENIKIKIKSKVPPGLQKPRPYVIAFGDDGHGMNATDLQYCLRFGHSSRYNSRKGIGRFGVGMTNGAISVCQFIEVYSRESQGNWLYTCLDIEDRSDNQDPQLLPAIQKDLPDEYKDLVGDIGTLVIWSQIDRIESSFDVDDLKHWLGRVYRKFIGEKIIKNKKIEKNQDLRKITIDDEKSIEMVKAFDPLYVIPEQFNILPENETATLIEEQKFECPTHMVDAPPGGEKKGIVTIRTSLTPESWRPAQKTSGRSKENNTRWVWENEGFSILRAGREVSYGPIMNFEPAKVVGDRFWSCEIEFEPILDHQFSMRNIKVGARPLIELREQLQKIVGPPIKHFKKKIQDHWSTKEIEEQQEGTGSIGRHKKAEEGIKRVTKPKKSDLSLEEQKKRAEEFAKERKLKEDEKIALLKKLLDPQGPPFIIEEDVNGRPDGPFIDIIPNLGKKLIIYNLKHAFFKSVYDKLHEAQQIAKKGATEDKRLVEITNELKVDLDYLIFAFADSRYDISGDVGEKQQKVDETLEDVEIGWSDKLRRVFRTSNE